MMYTIVFEKRCEMRWNHVFHQWIIIAKRFSITNNIAIARYLEFIHIYIFLCKNTIKNLSNNIVNLINNNNKKWEVNQEYIRLHNILIVGRY
jgi:hypothetical protein